MKKTAQFALLLSGVMLAVFFIAPSNTMAYTIARESSVEYLTHNPKPLNATTDFNLSVSSQVATGTAGTLQTYLLWDSSVATSGQLVYWQLYSSTYRDCYSDPISADSYAVPEIGGGWSVAPIRLIQLHGTACSLTYTQFSGSYRFREKDSATGSTISGMYLPYPNWYLITTDTATSTVYSYANDILATATSTNSTYCNDTFNDGSIGSDFANGLCNVAAFIFIPDRDVLYSFQQLQGQLQGAIPFAYFYDVVSAVNGLTASTTQNTPDFGVSLPDFGSTTPIGNILPAHVSFLSTTTIAQYVPDSARQTFLALFAAGIWIEVVLHIYHRIRPHKPLS